MTSEFLLVSFPVTSEAGFGKPVPAELRMGMLYLTQKIKEERQIFYYLS